MAKAARKKRKKGSSPAKRKKARPAPARASKPKGKKTHDTLPISAGPQLNVVYASSELAPFAKTGGLADVAAALPTVLADRGANVTVMLPLYRCVRESSVKLKELSPASINVPLGPHSVRMGLELSLIHI